MVDLVPETRRRFGCADGLEGRRVVPYYSRAEIDARGAASARR